MQVHEQRVVMALRALNSELAGSNRVVAARLGLNDSDLAVLDLLHRDGPQSPTTLARRTRMSPTTMTNVLRRLTRDGWIERRLSDRDLRSFTIHPTSVERLAEIFRPANEQFTALIADWPVEHTDALIGFLENATDVIRHKADDLVARRTTGDSRIDKPHRIGLDRPVDVAASLPTVDIAADRGHERRLGSAHQGVESDIVSAFTVVS